jgi:hypothetical protein
MIWKKSIFASIRKKGSEACPRLSDPLDLLTIAFLRLGWPQLHNEVKSVMG